MIPAYFRFGGFGKWTAAAVLAMGLVLGWTSGQSAAASSAPMSADRLANIDRTARAGISQAAAGPKMPAGLQFFRNPRPICHAAFVFAEGPYRTLDHRFGKKYAGFAPWLSQLVFHGPRQLWGPARCRRSRFRAGALAISSNGLGMTFPANWKYTRLGRLTLGSQRMAAAFRLYAGKRGKKVVIFIQKGRWPLAELTGSGLSFHLAGGGPAWAKAKRSRPRPALVQALNYANATPWDLFPLVGARRIGPAKWQATLLQKTYRRIEIKKCFAAARDLMFNGRLFALAGAAQKGRHGRGSMTLFLPTGAFVAQVWVRFPPGLRHRSQIRLEEQIFRGIRPLSKDVGAPAVRRKRR